MNPREFIELAMKLMKEYGKENIINAFNDAITIFETMHKEL